jgi:hypothetical protein
MLHLGGVLRRVSSAIQARRDRRARMKRESRKRQIERYFDKTYVDLLFARTEMIGQAIGCPASELQPLVDELVDEGRLFYDGHTRLYSRRSVPF